MKIRPKRLQQGDVVALVALSSPVQIEQMTEKIALLERLGLRYKLGKTISAQLSDAERVEELHTFIEDPEVRAIFCVRGGYGVARLVDKIDYVLLEENPKIVWGFSDVTYLHTVLNEFSDVVTFHGPMLSDGEKPLDALSEKMFQQLFTPMEIQYGEHIAPLETVVGGVARGELVGGNLNRLVSTLGTKYEVDVRGKIVLLEDAGECIGRLDQMLNQLRLSRKLEQAAGFVLGSFTELSDGETEDDVVKLFASYLELLQKPVLARFAIGHCVPNIAVPLGVEVILDADQKMLRILPGVE